MKAYRFFVTSVVSLALMGSLTACFRGTSQRAEQEAQEEQAEGAVPEEETEVIPAEPADELPEEEPEKKQVTLDLSDSATRQEMNRYLANYERASDYGGFFWDYSSFGEWDANSIPDSYLAWFAVQYCGLYQADSIEDADIDETGAADWGDGESGGAKSRCNQRVETTTLNSILHRYFGEDVSMEGLTDPGLHVIDGYAYWGVTAPYGQSSFSQICTTEAEDLGDGVYKVAFQAVGPVNSWELPGADELNAMTPAELLEYLEGVNTRADEIVSIPGWAMVRLTQDDDRPYEMLGYLKGAEASEEQEVDEPETEPESESEPEQEVLHFSVCDFVVPEPWTGEVYGDVDPNTRGDLLMWIDWTIADFRVQDMYALEDLVTHREAGLLESYTLDNGYEVSIYESMLSSIFAVITNDQGDNISVGTDCWFILQNRDRAVSIDKQGRVEEYADFLGRVCDPSTDDPEEIAFTVLKTCVEGVRF